MELPSLIPWIWVGNSRHPWQPWIVATRFGEAEGKCGASFSNTSPSFLAEGQSKSAMVLVRKKRFYKSPPPPPPPPPPQIIWKSCTMRLSSISLYDVKNTDGTSLLEIFTTLVKINQWLLIIEDGILTCLMGSIENYF